MSAAIGDRFGLGWRPELAPAILACRDRIDVVELIAEDAMDAPPSVRRALRTLARQVPLLLHGTGLGPASMEPVDPSRVERLARLTGEIEPETVSEHVAFVRAGGHEIGHLASPPRTAAVVESTARNLRAIARIVGETPDLENIATLLDPPASVLDEWDFLGSVAAASGCGLLLDLHNLYANATNFGRNPAAELARAPLERVRTVHLAGGSFIPSPFPGDAPRVLDDHLHPVPDPVFALLEEVAARVPHSLTVVLERDGAYPPFQDLLAEIDAARAAVRRGRARAGSAPGPVRSSAASSAPVSEEDASRVEALLAHAYVDERARNALERDPAGAARAAGLSDQVAAAFARLDRTGLRLAARSFARKRAARISSPKG